MERRISLIFIVAVKPGDCAIGMLLVFLIGAGRMHCYLQIPRLYMWCSGLVLVLPCLVSVKTPVSVRFSKNVALFTILFDVLYDAKLA